MPDPSQIKGFLTAQSSGVTNSIAVPVPAGAVAGDGILIILGGRITPTATQFTATVGTNAGGFSLLASSASGATNCHTGIYLKIAVGGETGFTFNIANSGALVATSILLNETQLSAVTGANAQSSSTSVGHGQLVPSAAPGIVFDFILNVSNTTAEEVMTWSTAGWTKLSDYAPAAAGMSVAYKLISDTSATGNTVITRSNNYWSHGRQFSLVSLAAPTADGSTQIEMGTTYAVGEEVSTAVDADGADTAVTVQESASAVDIQYASGSTEISLSGDSVGEVIRLAEGSTVIDVDGTGFGQFVIEDASGSTVVTTDGAATGEAIQLADGYTEISTDAEASAEFVIVDASGSDDLTVDGSATAEFVTPDAVGDTLIAVDGAATGEAIRLADGYTEISTDAEATAEFVTVDASGSDDLTVDGSAVGALWADVSGQSDIVVSDGVTCVAILSADGQTQIFFDYNLGFTFEIRSAVGSDDIVVSDYATSFALREATGVDDSIVVVGSVVSEEIQGASGSDAIEVVGTGDARNLAYVDISVEFDFAHPWVFGDVTASNMEYSSSWPESLWAFGRVEV